ncbi:MAG: hypothetical protein E7186_04495 [Erysipelotrichaceae bacterium]|nr:hypothetical protein [Erysipelotrichaceae bacterium]
MRIVLFWVLQCTWGILQTFLGLLVFLVHYKDRHYFYKGAIATEWHRNEGLSLGLFIFVWPNDERVVVHEYGHCIQSALLGPLYLPIIGIPSAIWANTPALEKARIHQHKSYYRFYPEKWANRLGKRATGKEPLE